MEKGLLEEWQREYERTRGTKRGAPGETPGLVEDHPKRDELEKEPQQFDPTTQKMRLTVVVPTNLRSRQTWHHFENGVTNGTTKLPRVHELKLRANYRAIVRSS